MFNKSHDLIKYIIKNIILNISAEKSKIEIETLHSI